MWIVTLLGFLILVNKVIFKGYISNRDEISKYYKKSKIFCLPSRWESYSIALIEAAYFGNYIISTDVGVAKELLNITKYGELIPKDNLNT